MEKENPLVQPYGGRDWLAKLSLIVRKCVVCCMFNEKYLLSSYDRTFAQSSHVHCCSHVTWISFSLMANLIVSKHFLHNTSQALAISHLMIPTSSMICSSFLFYFLFRSPGFSFVNLGLLPLRLLLVVYGHGSHRQCVLNVSSQSILSFPCWVALASLAGSWDLVTFGQT